MLKDNDIRVTLIDELNRINAQHDYRIIEELAVCDGEARVDVAVANGRLCGYEIKSDADTLERLALQQKCYDKTFDTVSIVVGEKFKDRIEECNSPYYAFGYDEYFSDVKQLFEHRANIDSLNDEDWGKEFDVRLTAMVKAMSILDKEGLFAQNQSRRSILINVELMPPDASNVQRALELNNSEDIEEYLQEAAESE